MANISRRNGRMLYPRIISDQRTEEEEKVALMPVKDGSALRAGLVDGRYNNFISKKTVGLLKATEDHIIPLQSWRIPREKIITNILKETTEKEKEEFL